MRKTVDAFKHTWNNIENNRIHIEFWVKPTSLRQIKGYFKQFSFDPDVA